MQYLVHVESDYRAFNAELDASVLHLKGRVVTVLSQLDKQNGTRYVPDSFCRCLAHTALRVLIAHTALRVLIAHTALRVLTAHTALRVLIAHTALRVLIAHTALRVLIAHTVLRVLIAHTALRVLFVSSEEDWRERVADLPVVDREDSLAEIPPDR